MSIREQKGSSAQYETDVTLHLSDFIRGIQKFWWLGAVLAVLFGGTVLCWTRANFMPLYQAFTTVTVLTQTEILSESGTQPAYSFSYSRATAERLAAAVQYAAQSDMLHQKICMELGVPAMPAQLSVEFAAGTNMMTVSALGQDPQQVCEVLRSFAAHYGDVTAYIIGPTMLVTISEPEYPTEPCNTREGEASAIQAALVGLALGAAWIVLYALLRQTVRTKADIRQDLDQTCIGVLPQVTFRRHKRRMDSRLLLTNPAVSRDFLESVRLLGDVVQNGLRDGEKVVLITSTAPEEGKSVLTLNLAAVLAKNEKTVLVLDADLRNYGSSALLHLDHTQNISAAVEQERSVHGHIQNCAALGIDVMTFDVQTQPLRQIIRTEHMQEIMDGLKSRYDLILIDTPPCGVMSDAAIIAGAADAAVYVVRQDTVLTSCVRKGLDLLLSTEIRLMGCVLNGAAAGLGGYGCGGYRHKAEIDI